MSFLSKFVRGAAEAGGELYADKARAELRAKLLADRDTVLAENRANVSSKKEDFESKQLSSRQAHDVSQSENLAADRTTTAETLTADKKAAAETKFGYDKELVKARGTTGTKTPSDVLKVKALVASGRVDNEADAWDLILSGANVPAKDIFKVLSESQTDSLGEKLKKGDEGYLSVEDLNKEAVRISRGEEKKTDPIKDPKLDKDKDKNTGTPTINTQAEYDALASGDTYIDSSDGIRYRKP